MCNFFFFRKKNVPEVLFTTVDPPPDMPVWSKGCLIQARWVNSMCQPVSSLSYFIIIMCHVDNIICHLTWSPWYHSLSLFFVLFMQLKCLSNDLHGFSHQVSVFSCLCCLAYRYLSFCLPFAPFPSNLPIVTQLSG